MILSRFPLSLISKVKKLDPTSLVELVHKIMKAFEELTKLGKLRKNRKIAIQAITNYDLLQPKLKLVTYTGNITYRVTTNEPKNQHGNLYTENCYALRLHQPEYQTKAMIESELEWLYELSNAGLPVPKPIPTREGESSIEIEISGAPARQCSLLRWVKGRMVKQAKPWHMKAMGRLIAQLHINASNWIPSTGFKRRHYDRNRLWGDDTGVGYKSSEVLSYLPESYHDDFYQVTSRLEAVMKDWGKSSDVYGLIHSDLGTKANILFHKRQARAIDFDDSGYGYWLYDLTTPLYDWEGDENWPVFRDALLTGYTEIRPFLPEHLEMLELFQAAHAVLEIFWGTAILIRNPDSSYWYDRREKAWRHIKTYQEENPEPAT
jgi:Ser/Thr protein kinase RdoA (MazF antagonist)